MPQDSYVNSSIEVLVKMGDLEERQRLLRDRILLIGKNMIETKEEIDKDLGSLKRDVEIMKGEIMRIREVLSSVGEELDNAAKRSDIIILEKQLKMFSPLEFARIEDVEKMIKESKNK